MSDKNNMYSDTKIWKYSLEAKGDKFDDSRERLRQAFSAFRSRVGQLIETISSDMSGLTIHNLSHLDALWEMVDILTGGEYELNPAETFVLGGAILLHDSGMTLAAYPGGIEEIKITPEYSDAVTLIKGGFEKSTDLLNAEVEKFALSETLRIKHAAKAEELASQVWKSPVDGTYIYLIEDGDLRDHYSRVIGRIAHSHHWDINQIPRELNSSLGALSGFPAEWTVDQVKVALLLRCIDAMQIDDRRAPRLLAPIREIGPVSMEHWRFQNKLAVPHHKEHRIVFTSKSPFSVDQATAWHLCFDTIQMIDRELRDSNELQIQRGIPEFQANGVAGASSADALAKYVEVSGWKPLPLNLKVSDVPKLAVTLGGKDLYNNPLAPLREMIQNAADAVEARSLVDKDFSIADGSISVRFVTANETTILEIEDNGVGMSEHVLTKALLDFGFSFWKSADARKEYPGLQAKSDGFRGKYGIGFFSVFMWSNQITVCSRRFNEGLTSTRVLEFRHGLESRPILRDALPSEHSSKWSTKISISLKSNFINAVNVGYENGEDDLFSYRSRRYELYGRRRPIFENRDWPNKLKLLCGILNIRVSLEIDGVSHQVSLPNWRDCSTNTFIDFFREVIFNSDPGIERFAATLTPLSKFPPLGGRCFISPYINRGNIAIYEKGIFISFSGQPGICGVALSNVINAARDRYSDESISRDKAWVDIVRAEGFRTCQNIGEKIALQQLLARLDKPDPNQPLFIRNRDFISLSQLNGFIADEGYFHIRLVEKGGESFSWPQAEKLIMITGLDIDERRVYPLIDFSGAVKSSEDIEAMLADDPEPLFAFLRNIRDHLGTNVKIQADHHQVSGYNNDYIDITFKIDRDCH